MSYFVLHFSKNRLFSRVDVRLSMKSEQKRESSNEARYHSNGSDTKERTPDKKSVKNVKHKGNKGLISHFFLSVTLLFLRRRRRRRAFAAERQEQQRDRSRAYDNAK